MGTSKKNNETNKKQSNQVKEANVKYNNENKEEKQNLVQNGKNINTNINKNNSNGNNVAKKTSLEADSDEEKENKDDIYKTSVESKYHVREKMLSAGVLENEKCVMDEIIEYKKKKKLEYDVFTIKKDLLDGEIQKIQNMIIEEVLTLAGYKERISNELIYEKQLIENARKDKNLTPEDLKVIEQRINKRIEVINGELAQEVPQEENENEVQPQEAAQSDKKDLIEKKQSSLKNQSIAKMNDFGNALEANATIRLADDPLLNKLKELENEYKAAMAYFQKNGLSEQENDALGKLREIQKILKLFESGKKIDQASLPKSVDPDYICGMSKKERFDNFTNIIKEYNQIKKSLVNDRNKILERFNQLAKKEQVKIVSIQKN